MKIRKKPIITEAMQFLDSNHDIVAKWCNGLVYNRADNLEPSIQIMTLEGIRTARVGDYIIKGSNGEFYPVAPLNFLKNYEVIEE